MREKQVECIFDATGPELLDLYEKFPEIDRPLVDAAMGLIGAGADLALKEGTSVPPEESKATQLRLILAEIRDIGKGGFDSPIGFSMMAQIAARMVPESQQWRMKFSDERSLDNNEGQKLAGIEQLLVILLAHLQIAKALKMTSEEENIYVTSTANSIRIECLVNNADLTTSSSDGHLDVLQGIYQTIHRRTSLRFAQDAIGDDDRPQDAEHAFVFVRSEIKCLRPSLEITRLAEEHQSRLRAIGDRLDKLYKGQIPDEFYDLLFHEINLGPDLILLFNLIEDPRNRDLELYLEFSELLYHLIRSGEYEDKEDEIMLTLERFEDYTSEDFLDRPRTLAEMTELAIQTFLPNRRERVIIECEDNCGEFNFNLTGPEQIMAVLMMRIMIASALQHSPLDQNVIVKITKSGEAWSVTNSVSDEHTYGSKGPYNPKGLGLHTGTSQASIHKYCVRNGILHDRRHLNKRSPRLQPGFQQCRSVLSFNENPKE